MGCVREAVVHSVVKCLNGLPVSVTRSDPSHDASAALSGPLSAEVSGRLEMLWHRYLYMYIACRDDGNLSSGVFIRAGCLDLILSPSRHLSSPPHPPVCGCVCVLRWDWLSSSCGMLKMLGSLRVSKSSLLVT